jgi:hypothetical protein
MLTTLKTTALAATLALGSAVPAAATVLNFEFFSDSIKETLLWGVKIDFGDFAFDGDRLNVTQGITLTQPAAPFDTGVGSYNYLASGSFLSFTVEGNTSDGAYSYRFTANCVPECVDGRGPFFFDGLRTGTASEAPLFAEFNWSAITDVTPQPPEPTAPIPLPAAGWLLLGGLGALGLMRRRRG